MQRVCAGLLWEGPAALVLKHPCPRKAAPVITGWGVGAEGAWCKWFRPPLLVLCCLLKLVYDEGQGREMAPILSLLPERGVHTHYCLESTPKRSISPRVFQASLRFLPSPCVWAICLPSNAVHLCSIPGRLTEF